MLLNFGAKIQIRSFVRDSIFGKLTQFGRVSKLNRDSYVPRLNVRDTYLFDSTKKVVHQIILLTFENKMSN